MPSTKKGTRRRRCGAGPLRNARRGHSRGRGGPDARWHCREENRVEGGRRIGCVGVAILPISRHAARKPRVETRGKRRAPKLGGSRRCRIDWIDRHLSEKENERILTGGRSGAPIWYAPLTLVRGGGHVCFLPRLSARSCGVVLTGEELFHRPRLQKELVLRAAERVTDAREEEPRQYDIAE